MGNANSQTAIADEQDRPVQTGFPRGQRSTERAS